jgi:hypothetical protein
MTAPPGEPEPGSDPEGGGVRESVPAYCTVNVTGAALINCEL